MRRVCAWAAPLVCLALAELAAADGDGPEDGDCPADGDCPVDAQAASVHLLQAGASLQVGGGGGSATHGAASDLRLAASAREAAGGAALAAASLGKEMLNSDAGSTSPAAAAAACVLLWAVAVGCVLGALTGRTGKAPAPVDATVWACSTLIVVITGFGIWGDVDGGGKPFNDWFAWHPVLMVTAFMCLMVLGRWVYTTESPLGSKEERRSVHRVIMLCAAILMCAGYLCIFMSHWPDKKFLGYYHHAHEWATWQRIVHVYLGYASILLALAQAVMGMLKYENLKGGQKTFTFHGTLGKVIILLSGGSVIMADWFWGWGSGITALLGALAGACVLFGTLWPTPAAGAPEHVAVTD